MHLSENLSQPYTVEGATRPLPTDANVPQKLISITQVIEIIGLSRSEVYRRMNRDAAETGGRFPKPVKLGRASRWPLREVINWVATQEAARGTQRTGQMA